MSSRSHGHTNSQEDALSIIQEATARGLRSCSACVLSCFSRVQLFATPWTVAHQTPVHGILQARILEWVALPSSRGSSQLKDWNCISYVSCIGRWVLYHYRPLGSARSCRCCGKVCLARSASSALHTQVSCWCSDGGRGLANAWLISTGPLPQRQRRPGPWGICSILSFSIFPTKDSWNPIFTASHISVWEVKGSDLWLSLILVSRWLHTSLSAAPTSLLNSH